MTAELSRLSPEIVIVALLCLTLVAAVGVVQWTRVRRHEAELEFTRQLVEQGLPVGEIERLLAKQPPPAKGFIEQFNSLGRGTKAGLIFVAFMAVVMVGSALQSYFFWVGRK
jgi:hypothetical protein